MELEELQIKLDNLLNDNVEFLTKLDMSKLDKDKTYIIGIKWKSDKDFNSILETLKATTKLLNKEGYKHIYFYLSDDYDITNFVDAQWLTHKISELENKNKRKK